jgi:hypothetical protein
MLVLHLDNWLGERTDEQLVRYLEYRWVPLLESRWENHWEEMLVDC